MRLSLLFALTIVPLFLSFTTPPKNILDDILEKHANAMGGYENWAKLKTLYISLNTGDGGVMDAYTKKPNKFKLIMRFAGYEWTKAWNGTEGWSIYNGVDKTMGIGEAKEMAEEPDFFDELMFAKEKGYEVQLISKEKLKGISVYKINVVKAVDDIVTYYLNANSFLIEQIDETSQDLKWENTNFTTILKDYQEWQGLKFPSRWGIIEGDKKPRWMEVYTVVVNEPIKDSIFEKK